MRIRRSFLVGFVAALLLLTSTVRGQTVNTQIAVAINQVLTGVSVFTRARFTTSGYLNWGSGTDAAGFGIRANAGVMQFKDDGGAWTAIASGSGAPASSSFLTRVAEASLSNETALGVLATGLLINTTTTGVPTIYAGASCTNQFISALSASGAATCASVTPTDFSGTLPVSKGGTGLTAGTSGGVLSFTASGTLASSAALAANQLVLGGGAGVVPATLGSLGTTTTVLHGNAGGAPTFGALVLTTDVSGILPSANGGTANAFFTVSGPTASTKTFTFPNASTTVLTTNAAVTPSQGGTGLSSYTTGQILYASAATTIAGLSDVATGNAVISGGVGIAPSYGKIGLTTHISGTLAAANGGTGLATYVVGDLLYANSTTTLARLASPAISFTIRSAGVGVAPVWDAPAVRLASAALTNAQIIALPTTPISMVAAPGAGFRIKPLSLTLYVNTTAGVYTNINTTYATLEVNYNGDTKYIMVPVVNDNTYTAPIADLTALLNTARTTVLDLVTYTTSIADGTSGDRGYGTPSSIPGISTQAQAENKALEIRIDNNGSGVLTGGNAANTLGYRLYYVIEAVP